MPPQARVESLRQRAHPQLAKNAMFRGDEMSANELPLREQAVVEALQAPLRVDEFVARRPRANEAAVPGRVSATARTARLRRIRAGLMEYAARQGHRPGHLRSLTLRRLLRSDNARELNLRMLTALREWTGAGQVFLWEIVSRNGGLRLIGQTGAVYAMQNDGIVPSLLIGSDAMIAADDISSEQRAIVARPKADSTRVEGEIIALAVAHSCRRWLALLSNLPDGQPDHATVEFALTLAGTAATVAAAWSEAGKRTAASAAPKHAIRKPA